MHIERLVLCFVAPPLAVMDEGINTVILVSFFTVLGWVPGVIVAVGIHFNALNWARFNREREETAEQMHADISRRHTLVNVPDAHRSGKERFRLAVRGEQMLERRKRKEKG